MVAAADTDFGMVLIENLRAYPQAQARSGNAFGGEEWIKNHFAHLRRHTMAGISNAYANAALTRAPIGNILFPHNDLASGGRGVYGIAEQIGEYLADVT